VLQLALELRRPGVRPAQALGDLGLERPAAREPVLAQRGPLALQLQLQARGELLLLACPAVEQAALVLRVARLGLGAAARQVGVELGPAAASEASMSLERSASWRARSSNCFWTASSSWARDCLALAQRPCSSSDHWACNSVSRL